MMPGELGWGVGGKSQEPRQREQAEEAQLEGSEALGCFWSCQPTT